MTIRTITVPTNKGPATIRCWPIPRVPAFVVTEAKKVIYDWSEGYTLTHKGTGWALGPRWKTVKDAKAACQEWWEKVLNFEWRRLWLTSTDPDELKKLPKKYRRWLREHSEEKT